MWYFGACFKLDLSKNFAPHVTMPAEPAVESVPEEMDIETVRTRRLAYLQQQDSQNRAAPAMTPIQRIMENEDREKVRLTVDRATIRADMITLFQKDYDQEIDFTVVDHRGDEEIGAGTGVAREVFTSFWKEVYDSILIGHTERVPIVIHDFFKEEWVAIARIICKGYMQRGYFPVRLSSSFICYSIFDNVPDDLIVESSYNYLAADEKDTLKQSIVDFKSCDEEELLDILDRLQCHQQPTAKNMKDIIFQLARQEMITRPHYREVIVKENMTTTSGDHECAIIRLRTLSIASVADHDETLRRNNFDLYAAI